MTTSTQLDTIRQEGQGLAQQIEQLQVCDAESFDLAASFLRAVKGYIRKVEEVTAPVIESARKALEAARAQRQTLAEPALQAEALLKRKITAYEQEQRRRAEEERRRAEAERRRLEEEAALQAALEREAAGQDGAAELPPMPIFTPPPQIHPPKAEGVAFRSTWRADVVDLKALIMAVASGKADVQCLTANQTYLNALARAQKSALTIPGVRAVEERTAAVRA